MAKSTKTDPAEVKRFEDAVKTKRAEFEKITSAASELEKKVDAVAAEIEEKTTGKIRTIDKNIKDVTATLNKCKAEISKLNIDAKTSVR